MTTIQTRDASVYWGSGTPFLVSETRTVSIDLGSDFAEDTVHGDRVRTFAPTFQNANVSVTGLYDTTLGKSDEIIKNARDAVSGKFSIYIGDSNRYFYGSAFVSVDEVGAPFDDFAPFNWSLKLTNTMGFYAK
jgi:hypothetical protein